MARILFLPIGLGLAHMGRSIVIAKEVEKLGEEIFFGAGGDASSIFTIEKIPYYPLPEFKHADYEQKIKHNNPFVYTRKLAEKFILSELKLYDKLKPDLVVYDLRITAKISAQIAHIPSVAINNTDATPYYDFSKIKIPIDTIVTKYLPCWLHSLFKKRYSQKFLQYLAPNLLIAVMMFETLRLSPVLLKFKYNFSRNPYQFLLGDLTLLLDIPEYRPVKKLPDTVKLVGPVFWNGTAKKPPWHKEIEDGKNIIYVTASGTGDKEIFMKTLAYLNNTNYIVVATTGNTLSPDEVKISYPGLFATDFLPGDWVMPKAKLMIFPGGNSTAYQALSYGIPQICTPFHFNQEDNANQLERLETGIIVNPYSNFNKDVLLNAIEKVIRDKKYQINAQKLKKILASYNGAKKAAEEIVKFCYNKHYS